MTGNTESKWNRFRERIEQLQDMYIPLIRHKGGRRKKSIWMNRKAMKAIEKKRRVYRK